jgi:hypothetical protein
MNVSEQRCTGVPVHTNRILLSGLTIVPSSTHSRGLPADENVLDCCCLTRSLAYSLIHSCTIGHSTHSMLFTDPHIHSFAHSVTHSLTGVCSCVRSIFPKDGSRIASRPSGLSMCTYCEGLAVIARRVIGCHSTRGSKADVARRVTGCRLTQETRCQYVLDDVESNVCQARMPFDSRNEVSICAG